MRLAFLFLFIVTSASAQLNVAFPGPGPIHVSGTIPITLDASCTGTGSASTIGCSSPMTVTAGDTIVVGCYTNGASFDPSNIFVNDVVNGYYDGVVGNLHPAGSNQWVNVSVFPNSASGSITPFCTNWESDGFGIAAYAFKGTRTTQVLDGAAAINLFNSVGVAATNPNAGTAGAPTNANEAIVCNLVLTSSTATTAGAGYSPAGTLTGVINTMAQYSEYIVNPVTANCPYGTSVAKTYTDTQIALLNASNPSGYKALTGMYGAPAAAQTNGATATVAILNGTSGSLTPLNAPTANTWWFLQSGSATTFDTGIAPLGSLKLLVNGVPHVIGDAATSIKVPSANTTTAYAWGTEGLLNNGPGMWLGSFMRIGTNEGANQGCDTWNIDSSLVEGAETTQVETNGSSVIGFRFEINGGATPTSPTLFPSTALNFAQDYYVITHVAGVNEANDDIYIFGETTPGTLPWTLFGHLTWPRSGPVRDTTTATAGSGASTITVASATGIQIGQTVWSGTTSTATPEITAGTTVTSIAGTSIGISAPTTTSMSATPVMFTGPVAATTGSVTAGSTTLTVTSGTGLVAGSPGTGQVVGMAGVLPGTLLNSGSGTSWVLSQPATTTQTSVPVQLWTPQTQHYGFHFGKYSSCSSSGDMWFGGFIFDPYATVLPLIANGTLPL